MKKEEKNVEKLVKNIKYLKLGLVIIIICMVIGVSYALLTANFVSEKNHIIKAGSLRLSLDDSTSDGITLENSLPETDNRGMKEESYNFTLTNTGSATFAYSIRLVDNEITEGKNRTTDSSLKYNITRDNMELITKKLLNTSTTTVDNTTNLATRVMDQGILKSNEKHDYSMNIWMDYDATVKNASDTEFSAHLEVQGTQFIEKDIEDYFSVTPGTGNLVFKSGTNFNNYFTVDGLSGYFPQDITLSSKIGDDVVTDISINLFKNNLYITGVTIPYTIKSIGENAFYGCKNMQGLSFENTEEHRAQIESIGGYAFYNSSLEGDLIIPASLKSLGIQALTYNKWTSVVFEDTAEHPSNLESFGWASLGHDPNLGKVILPNTSFTFGTVPFGAVPFVDNPKLFVINFNGTMSEWNTDNNTIIKERSYIKTIHCTDGDISI